MQVDQDKTPGGRHFLEAIDKNSVVISASESSGMNFKESKLGPTRAVPSMIGFTYAPCGQEVPVYRT
jgi:hypothetical protein